MKEFLFPQDYMELFLLNPDLYKKVILTKRQLRILKIMEKYHSFTARDLSNILKISIQSASGQMSRLYNTGYIDRLVVEQESGGVEYEYRISFLIKRKTQPKLGLR